jgi:hypothetical protein
MHIFLSFDIFSSAIIQGSFCIKTMTGFRYLPFYCKLHHKWGKIINVCKNGIRIWLQVLPFITWIYIHIYITFCRSKVSQNDCRIWNKSYKYKSHKYSTTDKGMVWSDMSKPALIFFFFTARVHTTKSTVKILAANMHCKYFLKIAEQGQYCSLPDPWRNVHP